MVLRHPFARVARVFVPSSFQPLSLISEILFLVEQIRPRTTQVYDLRAPISVLFQPRALEAVESVGDSFTAADDALVLVVAERALVADAHESGRAHVGVADRAFAVAFVAKAADGDAAGLATHDEIGVMARHFGGVVEKLVLWVIVCSRFVVFVATPDRWW